MDAFTDPWQQSRATLGMMRGMGLGQQQQQGMPINGMAGNGGSGLGQSMPSAATQSNPYGALANQAQNLGGQMSGMFIKDALANKKTQGGTQNAEQTARDAMANQMMNSVQPTTALDRIAGMHDALVQQYGPSLMGL